MSSWFISTNHNEPFNLKFDVSSLTKNHAYSSKEM